MADEYDDIVEPTVHRVTVRNRIDGRRRDVARIVLRLYRAAGLPLRERMLGCLLKPLGPLSLSVVSAGAFSVFLLRGAQVTLDDVLRISNEQMVELARFVEQVSPDALQDVARLVADNPAGMATFSAAAAVLLLQTMSGGAKGRARRAGARKS